MKEKNLKNVIETNIPLESLFNLLLNHALSSIDAKAGSLMTVNRKRGILQIRSRLGIPKKGRKGEPEYSIDGNSIASQAINSKHLVVHNDLLSESDKNYVPSRSDNKIRSILSVPIIHKNEVIAVINADSESKEFFNEEKEKTLVDIAAEVAPIISERISFLDAIKEVSIELSKSPAEGDVDEVLQIISDVAVKSLGIDIVSLYEYDHSKDEFIIEKGGPKIGGSLNDDTYMKTKVEKRDVPYQVLKKRDGPLFFQDVTKIDFLSKEIKRKPGRERQRFIEREKIKSMAAFLLPNRAYLDPKEKVVGVLFANYKSEHDFNVDEIDALATFADYAATAILTSRKEKQRREEAKKLERAKSAERLKFVLDNMLNAVMGDFDLDSVLDKVLDTIMETLQAKACSIYTEDHENEPGVIKCIAGAGFAKNIVGKAKYKIGEGLTGKIADEGCDIIISGKKDLEKIKSEGHWKGAYDDLQWSDKEKFKNLIGVPIKIESELMGVIKAENKIGKDNASFTNDDLESLKIIAAVIGLAIDNARLHKRIEYELKSFSAQAAHRINNQLTDYADIELDIKKACSDLHNTTENIKQVVRDIQQFGKPLKLKRVLCSINKIIKDEAWHAQPKQDEFEDVIIDTSNLDENIPVCLIDSTYFAESIKELINNSKKAINQNKIRLGRISFTTKHVIKNDKQFAFVSIEDDGPGMPENFPIFEPYKTTNPESTGLGLATVKEVVEKHGGKIFAKNRGSARDGARIEFEIPIKLEENTNE